MKRRKEALRQKPTAPQAPAATGKLTPATNAKAASGQAETPGLEQATTEEAVAAWRNEGDPN